uniref:RNA helicase n=1 Tax=Kalanchoe fedtschenkoi TaxID=63787 RepID=A0A7N0UZE4_KALFE
MTDSESSSIDIKPEPQPAPTPTKRWADVADDEEAEAAAAGSEEVPDVKSLSIDDQHESKSEFLEDPDDANIKAVTSGDTPYTSAKTFEELNLSPDLIKGLYVEMRFKKPSKIQAVSLPMILTPPYKDLIAQAHNGSGKTTCFVLGMLSRVDPSQKVPQALCVCPTRELAIQNLEVLQKMGKYTGITSECAVPKDSVSRIPASKRPVVMSQVVIGTPGTINSLIATKKLSINFLRILVFDEADHMLAEDGFKDDSLRIMKAIDRSNNRCQVLLFSATFNEAVKSFVTKVVKDHNQLFVKKEELSLDSIKQYKVNCPDELSKINVIKDKILELGQKVGQTIIFVRSRISARNLHNALVEFGYEVTTIQGALDQADRDKIVKEFKDGLTQILISTDLLARGFDQSQVNLVVNYDLPIKYETREPDFEVYLHRIGRAGRFGRKGAIFNLMCTNADRRIIEQIENHFRISIEEVDLQSEKAFETALEKAGLL